jgi:hypothetical protein
MSVSWNLLNYPALHQERRRRHRIITSLAGLMMGALMAAASLFWMERSIQGLRLQQAQLQAQWGKARLELKLEQQQVAVRESSRQQAQHLRQVSQQHQAWAVLNEALLRETQETSWRLARLQLEPGKLELSGWSRDFEALSAARHKLMAQMQAHWPEPAAAATAPNASLNATPSSVTGSAPIPSSTELVRQTSVSARGGPSLDGFTEPVGLDFVWVSPWPILKPLAVPAKNMAKGGAP